MLAIVSSFNIYLGIADSSFGVQQVSLTHLFEMLAHVVDLSVLEKSVVIFKGETVFKHTI